ncbi:hypothetical protein [Ethanoligenens harbinense]|uniref:Uncharacterized protein n=1 Tax=Ethanoligenens harbinense (strain DSM 18485 / JCM 12961 / CGMCC 1.5033 / YUAN-3) TaxID=663278 RepID=E6U5Q6_ETHHY|nr:hypothetical protein [Ethanoligenens harbinense]ADU26815.1 hypothetical protein Ethha_1272 [Ethanoligenens harbinense YUAN-3]AVQ95923.1 hypothetical protein CXQ68_06555 [Ethanoligenens harbinense YUAN-3]AYF38585.1 hypothetical protein CXP51_06425 [Ethanoligenens harbinense]AYF41331.1 hypothetical protein CN246_06560 [Ethanoligenens harbinense]QCN92164.1 hypothetical protein DRA42_06580 [Ethanoligenens harbinense]
MSSEIELQINTLIDALRTKEQEEKRRYDAAIDIEDMAEAKEVMLDARTKIQQLRKWSESLTSVQKEIAGSYLASNRIIITPTVVSQPAIEKELEPPNAEAVPMELEQNSEDASYSSAGDYVRQKLYQLSKSGFVFSEEQLRNMQDSAWSRRILGLPHQFARIYDETKEILRQTSIAGTPRRYWVKDRFKFGDVILLIYSGWASIYLPYFDDWYDSLNKHFDKTSDERQIQELFPNSIVESQQLEETASEQVKVGFYVRTKLRDLCDTGFQPTENELHLWQDKNWSKRVLNLNYPFAKLLCEKDFLGEQTGSESSKNRYWAEAFKLGTTTILFCSQWYRPDREYFDRWYVSLKTQIENSHLIPITLSPEETSSIPDTNESAETRNPVPSGFTLLGKTYATKSWDDVLVKLCEAMILKKPYKALVIGVKQLVQSGGSPVLWLDERDNSAESYILSNGLSVAKNKASGEIKSCCERILNLCGYDRSELKIS